MRDGESSVEECESQSLRIPVGTNLAEAERWMIMATLEKCRGNKTRAAALLGVSLKTLYNRLNAYRGQGVLAGTGETTWPERPKRPSPERPKRHGPTITEA